MNLLHFAAQTARQQFTGTMQASVLLHEAAVALARARGAKYGVCGEWDRLPTSLKVDLLSACEDIVHDFAPGKCAGGCGRYVDELYCQGCAVFGEGA